MASSSSSGDGPSTSGAGGQRPEREQFWDFVPLTVTNTRASTVALQELRLAVMSNDIVLARNAAKKLKATGMFPDAAVTAEARDDPKSKRHGPLHVAAANKHKKICKMLVEDYKCDPNANNADDATPLYLATQLEGSQPVVRYLINCGADPEKANNHGITPLHNAARRGDCEIAKYLLSKGVNVDPICQDGESPLHFAALHGRAKMVKLLLDHDANPNRLSHDHHTPLVASLFGSSLECLQAFIQAGANINTGSPVTPLSVAAHKGLADCVKYLLGIGADPNERNEYGKLPLEIAASKGWMECLKILLPVTKPLQKYANLGNAQILEQEITALKLGHEHPSLYAKRSLCHLHNRDQLRYLDDALSYMNALKPDSILPCSEEEAKQSVLAYCKEWKARYPD